MMTNAIHDSKYHAFLFHVSKKNDSIFVTHRQRIFQDIIQRKTFLLLEATNGGFNVIRKERRILFPSLLLHLVVEWSRSVDNETFDAFMKNVIQDSIVTPYMDEDTIRDGKIFR